MQFFDVHIILPLIRMKTNLHTNKMDMLFILHEELNLN